MKKDYYLGLDMGTGSTGWAVTNEQYEILRAHGKALWGVRLFESAMTAEERRTFRTSRRRLARRNWRLQLLQEIFAEEINKIDDGFYLRMKESRYTPEDKRDGSGNCPELPYALFVDKDFTDKEYHKKFPTIYHLRKYLMSTGDTPDVRLVYLALHHILKHRGHFLFSGSMDEIQEFKNVFSQFIESLKNEELDFEVEISQEQYKQIEDILKDKNKTKSSKKAELSKLINANTKCEKAVMSLITGGTVKLSELFGNDELDGIEKSKISFSDASYDDYAGIVESDLGEQFVIIEKAKAIYDWSILSDILGEYTLLSEAKVALYDKHKKDLKYLKDLVKENLGKEVYREVFVRNEENCNNYCAYIGMSKQNGKKADLAGKKCSRDDFYAFLKKTVVQALPDPSIAQYMVDEIDRESFLPKQVTKDNGVIPHQIHLQELNRILDNLSDRIPLLKEEGDKIRQLLTFRIPYYVGPLNGIRKGNDRTNWVVRKTNAEKIYPWNFDQVIDQEASAEKFIRRMTNRCTYLYNEDVLPKYSLLYSKFMVLNELNNLKINGEPIDIPLKQRIYEDLFQRTRKVTQKKLKDYLVKEGIISRSEHKTVDIAGIDGDFKASLTAYHDLKEKLTGCTLSDKEKEDLILNITLFGEDKKLLNKRITGLFPNLTDAQKKAVCTLSYKGWGRLSEKFLEGITAPDPETGEAYTIIRSMWESNNNLMQLLSNQFGFLDAIETENGKEEIEGITYELLENQPVSPAVKRQIWQTLLIVKELCKVMGQPPKRVFVEMAREKAESKRTDSRKKQLIELYRKCKEEERDWVNELNSTNDSTLRSDKLYLYYTQKGRCMYSGDPIDLAELWDNQKYDIDHIYPQSKVMDDSLSNRVLVKKVANADKSDEYPIKDSIRNKMKPFWKSLLDGGFISKEKYDRLTRSTGFEARELAGFIERQLVETRQGTKAVASILRQVLPDTEIVYVKAKVVSQFRKDFSLIKVREMNDYHHAKDAYLNVVVGNVYYTKFTKSAAWFIENNPYRSYNLKTMFTSGKDVERNGEVAWKGGNNGTIKTVKKMMQRNNILVTRRSYREKGVLFDVQILKKGKGQVAIKDSDDRLKNIEKYGAYNKEKGTYFMLVSSIDKKGSTMKTLEHIPIRFAEKFEKDENTAIEFLIRDRGLNNPKILLPCIKKDTLFKVDGFYMWLSSRTGNHLVFKGANQLLLSEKDEATLKKIIKFLKRRKSNRDLKILEEDKILVEDLVHLYDSFLNKIKNTVYGVKLSAQETTLTENRQTFLELTAEDKCIVLEEILHLFQCSIGSADLRLIHGKGQVGILTLNYNITKYNNISIINQSPTGIYEQGIDLQKL